MATVSSHHVVPLAYGVIGLLVLSVGGLAILNHLSDK